MLNKKYKEINDFPQVKHFCVEENIEMIQTCRLCWTITYTSLVLF